MDHAGRYSEEELERQRTAARQADVFTPAATYKVGDVLDYKGDRIVITGVFGDIIHGAVTKASDIKQIERIRRKSGDLFRDLGDSLRAMRRAGHGSLAIMVLDALATLNDNLDEGG